MLYDSFSSFIKFWSTERNTENTMLDLCFNEEKDYSEENASDIEDFCSTILTISVWGWTEKSVW